jgi:hypothetical protein
MKQQRDGTVIEVTLSLAETGSQSVAEATP